MSVELRALVIEAVTHLVSDDRAHPAVIHGVVSVRIEERRLHDSGRKYDLVHRPDCSMR